MTLRPLGCVAAFAVCWLATPRLLCEEPVPPAGPLGPAPSTAPLLPSTAPTGGDDLLTRLAERIRQADERIAALGGATRPQAQAMTTTSPEALRAQRDRDEALESFQRALQDYLARGGGASRDRLAVADARGEAEQRRTFDAGNELAVAECYRELLAAGKGQDGDVEGGWQALGHIQPDRLPEPDLPRFLYLRVWFTAERARRAAPDARPALIADAQQQARDLAARFPASELARTAPTLTADLAPDLAAPATGTAP